MEHLAPHRSPRPLWWTALVLLVIVSLVWLINKNVRTPNTVPSTSQQSWHSAVFLLVLAFIATAISFVRLLRGRRIVWEPLRLDQIKWSACLDTALIALFFLVLLARLEGQSRWVWVALALMYASIIVNAYLAYGLHRSVRELLAFWGTISMWDVMTLRVPHSRLHPGCDQCDFAADEPGPPIRTFREVLTVLLIAPLMAPVLASTALVKASAVFLFPLVYIALSFDAQDHLALSDQTRKRWRSSFKLVWVSLALLSLLILLLKVFVYAYWNAIGAYWSSFPLLRFIEYPFAPASFYPWHITMGLNAVIVLILIALVDQCVHRLDDLQVPPVKIAVRLKTIRFLFRLRTLLSLYNWICLTMLTLPLFRHMELPGIRWEILPK